METHINNKDNEEIYIPHEIIGFMIKENISKIAAWRKYKNISQAELAKKLEISQSAMSQIEKKSTKPQQKTLQKIADILNINIMAL